MLKVKRHVYKSDQSLAPSKRASIEGKGEEVHFKNQENLEVLFKLNKLRNLRKEEHSRINSIRRLKSIIFTFT